MSKGEFFAIERRRSSAAALGLFKRKFAADAEVLSYRGIDVYWHSGLGTWGLFGETDGKNDESRPWNAFGHNPLTFQQNIVVEINQPRRGIDTNLQSVFATDGGGRTWVLHQGRMTVSLARVKEGDFVAVTRLEPATVRFSDGSSRPYHPVACMDDPAADVRSAVAEFVRNCALVRLSAGLSPKLAKALAAARQAEHTLTPEIGGSYETASRGSVIAHRNHAVVWKALAAELKRRGLSHANTRVLGLGPDLFTTEDPLALFEIKTRVDPADVFKAIGQLAVYKHILKMPFRKVLVVPAGMGEGMASTINALGVLRVDYVRQARSVCFDGAQLDRCLGAGKRG